MPILQFIYRSEMSIVCVCRTVKIQFTILELLSTPSYSHPLCRYAPLCVWVPLFKNFGSTPAYN